MERTTFGLLFYIRGDKLNKLVATKSAANDRTGRHIIDKQRRRKKDELQTAEKESAQTCLEIKTDKMKGAAVEVGTIIIDGIGSMIM